MLSLIQQLEPVRKFITTLPITAELLEDQAGAKAYFDGRLANHVMQKLEKQVLGGSGVSPAIEGIVQEVVLIQSLTQQDHILHLLVVN